MNTNTKDVSIEDILDDEEINEDSLNPEDVTDGFLGDLDLSEDGPDPDIPDECRKVKEDPQEGIDKKDEDKSDKPKKKKATKKKSRKKNNTQPIENQPLDSLVGAMNPTGELHSLVANPTANDKLLEALRNEEPSSSLFNKIMVELGEELSYLKGLRAKSFTKGADAKEISEISFKRVRSLKELVEAISKREVAKQKNEGKIDFRGEGFEKVMKFFFDTIKDTFNKISLPEQYGNIFFVQFMQEIGEDFEDRIEKIYYGKE